MGIQSLIKQLEDLNVDLYGSDFLLTWDKSDAQLRAYMLTAQILRAMREKNISTRLFDSGLGISLFRDNSTRTRFSFASACNLLGLGVADFDEGKSQVAHGETVRETANMISFMADVVGIRDDMYIGKGNTYMRDFASFLQDGYDDGTLAQRPAVVNLQCDIDHPTQSMSDLMHIAHHFGGLQNLRGKKIAMSWAYSPSYGKPLSVPQGIIGLMSRFGMEVVLAHPHGYNVMPEVTDLAKTQAEQSGGSFVVTDSMAHAFEGADIVYPKSWAPFAAMQQRTELYSAGEADSMAYLERQLLEQNANFKDWECTEQLMSTTKDGKALYMHCLPADITGVSCGHGEVAASVFDRYRTPLYHEASYKPYVIAAMILQARAQNPVEFFKDILKDKPKRKCD